MNSVVCSYIVVHKWSLFCGILAKQRTVLVLVTILLQKPAVAFVEM